MRISLADLTNVYNIFFKKLNHIALMNNGNMKVIDANKYYRYTFCLAK